MFDRVLFILVTCSLDQKRAQVFQNVSNNLLQLNSDFDIFKNFMVFDNASTIPDTIMELSKYPLVFQSSKNIGYWSALYWCLNNYQNFLKSKFDYVYIIESDMLHFNFGKLKSAISFLDDHDDVGSVRTQKFSKFFKSFYSKDSLLSTFTHDAIRLTSYPSGEKAWFQKIENCENIYLSNLHGKIVGLNRLMVMKEIFDEFKDGSTVSEADYFHKYFNRYRLTGVLNGGVFTDKLASRLQKGKVTMGSYSKADGIDSDAYHPTRLDQIITSGFEVIRL